MTDTSAALWIAVVAGVPATLAAIGNLLVILRTKRIEENVHKIEQQTNSMNSTMVASAKSEGRIEGRERAEAAAVQAASLAAAATPSVPLVIAPEARQDEIVRWVAQGIAQGIVMEKTRRAVEGNGPPR